MKFRVKEKYLINGPNIFIIEMKRFIIWREAPHIIYLNDNTLAKECYLKNNKVKYNSFIYFNHDDVIKQLKMLKEYYNNHSLLDEIKEWRESNRKLKDIIKNI